MDVSANASSRISGGTNNSRRTWAITPKTRSSSTRQARTCCSIICLRANSTSIRLEIPEAALEVTLDLEKGCTGYGVSTGLSSKGAPKMMEIMVKTSQSRHGLGLCLLRHGASQQPVVAQPRHYTSEGQPTDPGVCPRDRGPLVTVLITRTDS